MTGNGDRAVDAGLRALLPGARALRAPALGSADKALSGAKVGVAAAAAPAPSKRQRKRDDYLRELARWPNKAHEAWHTLADPERVTVLIYMAEVYGSAFAGAFHRETKRARKPEVVDAHFVNVPWLTHRKALARGYGLAHRTSDEAARARGSVDEFWVNPQGRVVIVHYSLDHAPPVDDVPDDIPPVPEEEPALEEARLYVHDYGPWMMRLRKEYKALEGMVGSPGYDDAYREFFAEFNEWVVPFLRDQSRARELRAELRLLNSDPNVLAELDREIEALEAMDMWRILVQRSDALPAPPSSDD